MWRRAGCRALHNERQGLIQQWDEAMAGMRQKDQAIQVLLTANAKSTACLAADAKSTACLASRPGASWLWLNRCQCIVQLAWGLPINFVPCAVFCTGVGTRTRHAQEAPAARVACTRAYKQGSSQSHSRPLRN
jgi:hypothetical protein